MTLLRRASIGAATIGGIVGLLLSATAIGEDLVTTSGAVSTLGSADPTAVGADPAQQEPGAPGVSDIGAAFKTEDTSVDAEIPKDLGDPISLETPSGELSIHAQDVAPTAGQGVAVSNDAAVVYANTGKDSDTSVVPIENGVETFTNIRSAGAAEEFRMTVDLDGAEEITQLQDGSVVVIDPTPNDKPSQDSLPAEVLGETAAATTVQQSTDIEIAKPDPTAAADVQAAVGSAGREKPATVSDDDVVRDPEPSAEQREALVGQAGPGAGPGVPSLDEAPTTDELEAEVAKTEALAESIAREDLNTIEQLGEAASDGLNANNSSTATDVGAVVATIEAPQSLDANGDTVETSLSIAGNVVTMHVSHRDEQVAYPIAADPIVSVVGTRWRVAYYPVYRWES